MAIGLATAIGLGGKLESENSGVAEIIRQTGEGISGSIRQAGAGVSAGLKTLDDEKKLRAKDAPKTFETDLMAGEKQRQEYVQAADEMNRKVYDAYNKYVNKEMSRGAYKQLMAKETGRMMNMKTDMEADYKVLTEELPEIDQDMFDVSEANNALMGKRIVRQKEVKQGEGESAKDQIGSEAEMVPGYFDLPYDEQRKLYKGGLKQLVGKARPIGATFSEAWKDAFGEDNLDAFIEESVVENADGTKSQTFKIKTEDAKNAFNQMMGMRGTNLSPKLNKYFRTLEVQARRVANDMNLSKEQTEFFVETQVERLAAEELQRNFDQSVRNRTKDRKDDNNPENEGKGMNIIISGGGSSVSDGKNVVNFVGQEVPNKDAISDANKEEIKKIQGLIADYESKLQSPGLSDANEKTYKKAINSLKNTANGLSKKRHKNYFDFSSVLNTDDPGMTFIKADNTEVVMLPQEIYKDESTGQLMIGGQIKTKIEEPLSGNLAGKMAVSTVLEDYSVPYNDGNKSKLFKDKPQLKPLFDKVDWTLLDKKQGAASKQEPKQGAKAPTKKDAVKILPSNTRLKKKDVESANFNTEQLQNNTPYFVDGVLYLWQDGQFKKVKR